MFLTEFLHALRRLWYLVLCGVLLAGGGAYYAWTHTEPRYKSEASVLLLPPDSTTKRAAPDGSNGNPLLYLGGLNQARDVLISAMSSSAQREAFDALFPETSYAVAVDPLSSGPIVVITTDSADSDTAASAVEHLLGELSQSFDEVQVELGVPEQSVIHSMQLTPSTTPEADTKPQVRAAALLGAGTLVAALLLVAVIDGLVRYATRVRRNRKATAELAAAQVSDPEQLDADTTADEAAETEQTETEPGSDAAGEAEPERAGPPTSEAEDVGPEDPEEPEEHRAARSELVSHASGSGS